MYLRLISSICVVVAIVSLSLWLFAKHDGQTPGTSHAPDMNHGSTVSDGVSLQEGGQSTFAALIEIVDLLEKEGSTNWSKVDIDGLREHLLDMDQLILNTTSMTSLVGEKQIQFNIRGTSSSVPSIHRMVPAHSRFIQQSRGWSISYGLDDDGATLAISAEDTATIERLSALGFYGFMSLDSHHQAHHYQMALGNSH
jgi:hypothetical protein